MSYKDKPLTWYQTKRDGPVHLGIGETPMKVATMDSKIFPDDGKIGAEIVQRWNAINVLAAYAEGKNKLPAAMVRYIIQTGKLP